MIIGVFILALAYLSYKGLIQVNWPAIQVQTQSAAYNASQVIMNSINHVSSQLSTHPSLAAAEGTRTIAAGVGFAGGFLMGLQH